jgi:hypothetical protein
VPTELGTDCAINIGEVCVEGHTSADYVENDVLLFWGGHDEVVLDDETGAEANIL